ncbi:MAG: phosphoglucosamine mutase, partial [Deltaproteobacteria bacterium]|nr:phosphoglucosamine mutase [Deltaproteobacteria bacterium]
AEAVKSAESRLKGLGRVLLRPSGTEPVVRVMVEGEDEALINALARECADIVAAAV